MNSLLLKIFSPWLGAASALIYSLEAAITARAEVHIIQASKHSIMLLFFLADRPIGLVMMSRG